jgi:hypothetical protein
MDQEDGLIWVYGPRDDPQAWLADTLARIATHPAHRLDELLPWNWIPTITAVAA